MLQVLKRPSKSNLWKDRRVRIVTPKLFIRCGYPLTFMGEADRINHEKRGEIEAFCRQQGVDGAEINKAIWEIAKALAYQIVRQKGFGGRERKIYTVEVPGTAGLVAKVDEIKYVNTGTYCPPHAYNTMDGYEVDPGFLDDAKRHTILQLNVSRPDLPDDATMNDEDMRAWREHFMLKIESSNVERLEEEQ